MTDLRTRLAEVLAVADECLADKKAPTNSPITVAALRDVLRSDALAHALEDAERYAWLRDAVDDDWEVRQWIDSDTQELHFGDGMDAAIDAARTKP